MIEKILSIDDNGAKLLMKDNIIINADLVNIYLVFDDGERRILGEIVNINENKINVAFLGEFKNNTFISGIMKKPKLSAMVRAISKEELSIIMTQNDNKAFTLGKSVLYNDYPVSVNVDSLFANHIAIFGNSGSGKSNGVAKILQSVFNESKIVANNSTFIVFDVRGEYNNAFSNLNSINPNYKFKNYTYNLKKNGDKLIKIPIWLLDINDIALLLGAFDYKQLVIIEKTLFILSIFSQGPNVAQKMKNHILARSIQNLLYSNQSASKIRSQVFEILSICSTPEFNMDVEINGVGYKRAFQKCFEIKRDGTFMESILIGEYISKFIDENLENKMMTAIGKCNLKDLEDALNFVIVSESILGNEMLYNSAIMLKMKIRSLIVSGYGKMFEYPEYVGMDGFIKSIITDDNHSRVQVINFNIEDLNSGMAAFATRTISKMFFEFNAKLTSRASMPVHIFLEEAHRLLKKDQLGVISEDIFEKIAIEGRKFGVILALISQRPSELSETVLSQCASFLLFRINHPIDIEYLKKAIPNINTEIIDKQRSLQPGYCVGIGNAFKVPMIIKLEKPNPEPYSQNTDIYHVWGGAYEDKGDLIEI